MLEVIKIIYYYFPQDMRKSQQEKKLTHLASIITSHTTITIWNGVAWQLN